MNIDIINQKDFENQIAIIRELMSSNGASVQITDFPQSTATLTMGQKELTLEVIGDFTESHPNRQLNIVIARKSYWLRSLDFRSRSIDASPTAFKASYSFTTDEIRSEGFSTDDPNFYRCIIPTDIEHIKSFIFIIDTIHYQTNTTIYGYDCIRVKIKETEFDIIQVKDKELNQGFYIFENLTAMKLPDFKKIVFAIRQAIGFTTGYMPGGKEFVFRGEEYHYSDKVGPALKSIYNPVNSNPYAKLYDQKDIAAQYMGKLTKLDAVVLSRLICLIKDKQKLSSTIILMMEASSVRSLLLIPGVFAIIIESLAKIILKAKKGTQRPINDTALATKITEELQEVLSPYQSVLSNKDFIRLHQRISDINRPVVLHRLTNDEKLTEPFFELGIPITKEDVAAIKHRNDLLHGDILLLDHTRITDEQINGYMLYVAGKLYTLISKLILKYAGYNGYVINYAKFHESSASTEEYYDKI